MFWLLAGFMGPPCYRYWNSADQTNELLMTCDDWEFSVDKDGTGNVHAIWSKSIGAASIEHLNATENITNTISFTGLGVDRINLIVGPDAKAHIFWQDFVTDDLYYWNSQDKNQTFVTIVEDNVIQNQDWDFDSMGKIHTSWNDGDSSGNDDVFYWNPSLSTPTTVLSGANAIVDVDKQDIVHIVFMSTQGTLGTLLYYWNNETGAAMPASSSNVLYFDGFTMANGTGYALFRSTPDLLHYWRSDGGEISFGSGEELSYVVDGAENIYLHWIGSGFIEEDDMFAAWEKQLNNFVYIPIVVSE